MVGRAIGAMIRGLWWTITRLWTMPVPRLALAAIIVWWGWGLWWGSVASWGATFLWPWIAAFGGALVVAAIASGAHHTAPAAYRQIAVARASAYALALLPAALAVGTWTLGYTALGHALGIAVEFAVAAGLGAHVWWGPELRT